MNEREFLKPESMYALMTLLFGTFLSFDLNEFMCISAFELSLSPCNSFFILLIRSVFLLCSFCSNILLQKRFFFCICLFICLHAFSIELYVEFSFLILESLILFVLLGSVPLSFESFFFHQYFFLVYFSQLYCQYSQLSSFFGLFISLCSCVFFLA